MAGFASLLRIDIDEVYHLNGAYSEQQHPVDSR